MNRVSFSGTLLANYIQHFKHTTSKDWTHFQYLGVAKNFDIYGKKFGSPASEKSLPGRFQFNFK